MASSDESSSDESVADSSSDASSDSHIKFKKRRRSRSRSSSTTSSDSSPQKHRSRSSHSKRKNVKRKLKEAARRSPERKEKERHASYKKSKRSRSSHSHRHSQVESSHDDEPFTVLLKIDENVSREAILFESKKTTDWENFKDAIHGHVFKRMVNQNINLSRGSSKQTICLTYSHHGHQTILCQDTWKAFKYFLSKTDGDSPVLIDATTNLPTISNMVYPMIEIDQVLQLLFHKVTLNRVINKPKQRILLFANLNFNSLKKRNSVRSSIYHL